MKHMVTNNLHVFTPYQHGFTAGRSCATKLFAALNCWTKSIDGGCSFCGCNLLKAFDSVPHTRLLTKLKSYSLTGTLLRWLKSYLVGRKQS